MFAWWRAPASSSTSSLSLARSSTCTNATSSLLQSLMLSPSASAAAASASSTLSSPSPWRECSLTPSPSSCAATPRRTLSSSKLNHNRNHLHNHNVDNRRQSEQHQEQQQQQQPQQPQQQQPQPSHAPASPWPGAAAAAAAGGALSSSSSSSSSISTPTPPRARHRSRGRAPAKPILRIFLVRHGHSLGNEDDTLYTRMADSSIPLSDRGRAEAAESGRALQRHFEDLYELRTLTPEQRRSVVAAHRCRLWTSPYTRARQTADIFAAAAQPWITDVSENVLLIEQQWGLFEGIPWTEIEASYPNEMAHYKKNVRFGGKFYARVPLGESRFDVCQRVQQSFGTLHRDCRDEHIQNFVIISHGVTLRAFNMMWNRLSPEWFESEPNPSNCSIRLIERTRSGHGYNDCGYVYRGPESRSNPAERKLDRLVFARDGVVTTTATTTTTTATAATTSPSSVLSSSVLSSSFDSTADKND